MKKQILCENGIIKNLTLEETIKEFNKIQYSKKVKSWNNKYDDDELLEFCYLGLMKAYNYYDINSKNNIFISYAQKVIYTLIATDYQKRNRQKRGGNCDICSIYSKSKDNDNVTVEDTLRDESISTENRILRNDLISKINKSLTTLSDDNKNIVNLYFINGLSYAEIGNIYGLTRQAVSYRVKCIKKKLLEEFSKYNITSDSLAELSI